MIKRIYNAGHINVSQPTTYFEKFYAEVFNDISGDRNTWVSDSEMKPALTRALYQYGGNIKLTKNKNRWLLRFPDDRKYTMFVMRWA